MPDRDNFKIGNFLRGVKRNIPLSSYTTFRIGGPAQYFFATDKKEELEKAILVAQKFKIPFFILGNGSNLLVSDEGYNGLVIKIENKELKVEEKEKRLIRAGAGLMLKNLVDFALGNSLEGIEWMAGIPGTVGGATRGNAGAFGGSMKESVKEVEALEIQKGGLKSRIFSKEECDFVYRGSIFKEKSNLIIFSVIFKLKKGDRKEIENRIKENLSYRKEKHPMEFPSAGSVFKNIGFREGILEEGSPEIAIFKELDKIPAGFLIEKVGLKGERSGQAQISEKHSNFIINLGGARAGDVLKLIDLVKKRVKENFDIEMEEEIQYLEKY